MARTVGIGIQSFEKLIENHYFYIDKTSFIKEWWENGDDVTLITRPRRFGKTLNMDMLERFFSVRYDGRGQVFEGLSIWKDERYRRLQGTYPVIFLSFADIKADNFTLARELICRNIQDLYNQYDYLLADGILKKWEMERFVRITSEPTDTLIAGALRDLAAYLYRCHGKRAIILLDEYDTPLQEAWVNGYWKEMAGFTRGLFNPSFKTNPYLERAVMTGITRVGKESIFSDLNNLEVVTATSEKYAECFGFTEDEVWEALKECGLYENRQDVKDWYDGFTFGGRRDIYNPWSIINYLDKKRLSAYWANTSSNRLIDKLIREGSAEIKLDMEELLGGKTISKDLDEQVVFDQLDEDENAIWALLLASGYLKVEEFTFNEATGDGVYRLALTDKEVYIMFRRLIKKWFSGPGTGYNEFIRALLTGDIKAMNVYMNKVALATISFFDSGKRPSKAAEPERFHSVEATTKGLIEPNPSVCFYHGFVLGLMVDLAERYVITSNRESGFGRYDVVLEPQSEKEDPVIFEFKVRNPEEEATLEDTAREARAQIDRKQYGAVLEAKGFPAERIRKYGFAFEGKQVLIQ